MLLQSVTTDTSTQVKYLPTKRSEHLSNSCEVRPSGLATRYKYKKESVHKLSVSFHHGTSISRELKRAWCRVMTGPREEHWRVLL